MPRETRVCMSYIRRLVYLSIKLGRRILILELTILSVASVIWFFGARTADGFLNIMFFLGVIVTFVGTIMAQGSGYELTGDSTEFMGNRNYDERVKQRWEDHRRGENAGCYLS